MKLDGFVKSVLKAVVYMIDEAAYRVDRVSDRASEFAATTKRAIYPNEDNTFRNIVSFAAGVGIGVAAGILLAPSSGEKLRNSIGGRVHNISDKIRHRGEPSATGTDVR